MQMPIWASLPSQSLNGITKKIDPIAQQVSTDPHRCSQLWTFTILYQTVTLYSSGSNQKSLQLSSSFKLWRVPYKPRHKTTSTTRTTRHSTSQSVSVQIIEIVVNKRCSNWNIHFFLSLFPHSFSHRLMSQSGLVPSRCESERARERDSSLSPRVNVGYVRATYKYVRITEWIYCLSLSLAQRIEARLWF